MRATTKISNNSSLYYLNKNFNNFMKISNQLSTEQQVVNLEDDPLSANIGMKMLNIISRSEQYNRNIKTGVGALNLVDGYLGSCKTIMDSVKTLTVGAAQSATATASTRAANAIELNEILRSLVSAGNAHDGSRYIFGGQNTTTPPFTIVNGRYVNYVGNDKDININADNGTTVAINVTGTSAYGNMTTTISGKDMNPDVSLVTDHSTRLADLNGGEGVPKGKIMVYYSAYPDGLEVDLSGCSTLEDVKDYIEKATLDASRDLDPKNCSWLDGGNLDWKDLTDRYVKVAVNPEHNGISLMEYDLGEPLPDPTPKELAKGLDYSNTAGTGYYAGGLGIKEGIAAKGETTVFDKPDYIYQSGNNTYYPALKVENVAGNKVATALGILGSATRFQPDSSVPPQATDPALEGFLHGKDLNPLLSNRTLLADLDGYNDSVYTFTNGAKPGSIVIQETTQDASNVFSNWNLSGLAKSDNTGPNGELYARAIRDGDSIYLEIYTKPVAKASAGDLVGTGVYTGNQAGGTVVIKEANNSGISGTVGLILPTTVKESTVNLAVDFVDTLQSSVYVPAFIEETDEFGRTLDVHNIASGWDIRGLDKPPAQGYDINHPASTDLDGDVSVNYRYDSASNRFIVELCRPSFNDQPAKVIATGFLELGDNYDPGDPGSVLKNTVSGRIELVGAEGFEGVKGSVFIELPSGAAFTGNNVGAGANDPASVTYQLRDDYVAAAGDAVVFGGAVELRGDLAVSGAGFNLAGDTVFLAGQRILNDVRLPNGGTIKANTILERDVLIPKGAYVETDAILAGTVLAEGQKLTLDAGATIPAGTVIPRGSYFETGAGFAAAGMGMTVTRPDPEGGPDIVTGQQPMGYDLRATFATVEDFNRAVEEAGIYVKSRVSEDGKSLEFQSSLAGAWLTVSEDTDCYEQMGDIHRQLSSLNLNGLVKGVNSDQSGNVYTEVVYYPPDPNSPDGLVHLVSEDGKDVAVEPGYYVRVYNSREEMEKSYEDRDNTRMVAEGFVPAGEINPAWDPADPTANPPFIGPPAVLGFQDNLILEERNGSGVWGTVNLDYYNDRAEYSIDANGEFNFNPYENGNITVFPGGLRPEGTRHATIQEWDIYKATPGITCDYSGAFHGVITGDASNPDGPAVKIYKDSSRTVMSSRSAAVGETYGDPPQPLPYSRDGKVILYEVDKYGKIALDADRQPIEAGALYVADSILADGQSDNFTLKTGANRNYGQDREENVFSTINDIIDALNQNDSDKLHDLIGSIQKDIDHILEAQGDAATRNKRLQLLSNRHADDQVKFQSTLVSRIGMDDQALSMAIMNFQAASNAYQAAMQVSGQMMQMSLLQYI